MPNPATPSPSLSPSAAGHRGSLRDWLDVLRPSQWTKNAIILAAFGFAYFDRSRATPLPLTSLAVIVPAVLLFCFVSSGIYILNDIRDAEADRHHPRKRFRPIASGRLPIAGARLLALGLLAGGLGCSLMISLAFAFTLFAYVVIQLLYTWKLKHVPLLDTTVIAAGFVLRAVAGAFALPSVTMSPWLLVCTFLLALFLALCKRRHEKANLADGSPNQRPSLSRYSLRALDVLVVSSALLTLAAYAAYTLWPVTVRKFGTNHLVFTTPVVAIGILRYLTLVYRRDQGDQPERILLTDVPLMIALASYAASVVMILKWWV